MITNKFKKQLRAAILFVAILVGFHSCDDFVNELPESDLATESFYRNNAQLELALIGVYDAMQEAYSEFAINTGEFRSDNFQPNGNNASRTALHNSVLDPGEGLLRWRDLYRVVDRANRIVIAAENIQGADLNIVGQALALRAKVYFDLARVFGDVPVFLAPVATIADAKRSQTSYREIIDNIVIPDMLTAEKYISTLQSEFRISKSGVLALQAEVYMWEKEELLAKGALLKLIGLGTHGLVQTPQAWQNLFLNQPSTGEFPDGPGKVQSGPELIFSIHYASAETTSGLARAYNAGAAVSVLSEELELKWIERFPVDSLGWATKYPDTPPVFTETQVLPGGIEIEVPLYGDWRHFATRNENATLEDGLGSTDIGLARCVKWIKNRSHIDPNDDNTNIPIYRFSDMILLLAEAELKLNNPTTCLTLINDVRRARKLPLATQAEFGSTQDAQLDFLLVERQLELVGEAKRWWDLVRNNKAIEVMTPILEFREIIPFGENRIVWPIFREHLLENTLLNQNPGWK